MNKPRSIKFMLFLTLLTLAIAIAFHSLIPRIDVKEYDQRQMDIKLRQQALEMLVERN